MVALSWSAGFVDAGCYQRLRETYTSHVTGATASVASHMLTGALPDAARFACAVAAFVAGLLLGATLRHVERREHIRSAFAAVLTCEIMLLVLFIFGAGRPAFPVLLLIGFVAAAMGMQTVTVTRVGTLRTYTTFHTGSLSKFAEAFTSHLFWAWERIRGRGVRRLLLVLRVTPRRDTFHHAAVSAAVWLAFLIGAFAGVGAFRRWGSVALIAAMAPLSWGVVVDWNKPAALGEKTSFTDLE